MRRLLYVCCGLSVLGVPAAYGHTGALDSEGCHPNVAHGSYHCHTGPMAGRQYSSKQEMLRARQQRERDQRSKARVAPRAYRGSAEADP